MQATSDAAAESARAASEMHYTTQLDLIKTELDTAFAECAERLHSSGAVQHDEEGSAQLDVAAFESSVRGVVDWFSRCMYNKVDELSESHRTTAREALKAQATVYESKLDNSRTAASVEKQATEVEMKATMERKIQEQVRAARGAGGREFDELQERIGELEAEVEKMKLQQGGLEDALTQTQSQLRARWEELTRCSSTLEDALKDLDVTTSNNATLEQRVADFVEESSKLRVECEQARSDLSDALQSLGIVTGENVSLSDQIKQLVQQASSADALRSKRDRAREQVAMLKKALQKLGEDNGALKTELSRSVEAHTAAVETERVALRAVQAKLDEAVAAGSGAAARLEEATQCTNRLEQDVERLEAEARASAEAFAKAEATRGAANETERQLRESRAMVDELQRTIDTAMSTLETLYKQLKLNLPDMGRVLSALVEALASPTKDAFDGLARAVEANEEMEAKISALEIAADERDALQLRVVELETQDSGQVGELKKQIAALQAEMGDVGSNAGAAAMEAQLWREAMAQTYNDVGMVLCDNGVSGQLAKSKEKSLSHEQVAAHVGELIARFGTLRASLKQTLTQLKSFDSLQDQMSKLEGAVREEARRERAALVTCALDSMSYLRAHLIHSLRGMREVEADASPPSFRHPPVENGGEHMLLPVCTPPREELVLRLELPSLDLLRVRSQSTLPGVRRGLSYLPRPVARRPQWGGGPENESPTKMLASGPPLSPPSATTRPQTTGPNATRPSLSYSRRPPPSDDLFRAAEPLHGGARSVSESQSAGELVGGRPLTSPKRAATSSTTAVVDSVHSAPLARRNAAGERKQMAERKPWEPVYVYRSACE